MCLCVYMYAYVHVGQPLMSQFIRHNPSFVFQIVTGISQISQTGFSGLEIQGAQRPLCLSLSFYPGLTLEAQGKMNFCSSCQAEVPDPSLFTS